MDNEKFQAVIAYFEEMNIKIPTEVKNAIQEVFEENDDVENVESFFKQDVEGFKRNEMKLNNSARMFLNGENEGSVVSTWTYYGEVDYSLTEKVEVLDKEGNQIEEVTNVENSEPGIIYNEDDWVVALFETTNWDTKSSDQVTRNLNLYIYCPYFFDEEE